MKGNKRHMTKRQRRQEGRRVRKWQRLKKWLANEASEELRLLDRNIRDCLDSDCKPNLALALSHAIEPNQLKHYLAVIIESPYNQDIICEIQRVLSGYQVPAQVTAIINDLEHKSRESELPIEEVASDALYDSVATLLKQNQPMLMPWVEHEIEQLESWNYKQESEWYLSSEVSLIYNPDIADLMMAICVMGLSKVLIDFVKWDQRVRHHIASEFEIAPSIDYIKFNYPDSIPIIIVLCNYVWESIWRIVHLHLPVVNRSKITISLDIEKPLQKDEINQLIKDFDLEPM